MNKWFNKQTVVSFILGGVLFSSAGVFATTQLNIVPNSYPIVVNDENADVEGYNIEGRTYLQLRDITNILGISLDFKNNTIYINTKDSNISDNKIDNNDPLTKTADGLTIFYYDKNSNRYSKTTGTQYIQLVEFLNEYKELGYSVEVENNLGKLINSQKTEPILTNIPIEQIDTFTMIKYDYYINIIIPLINSFDPTKPTSE